MVNEIEVKIRNIDKAKIVKRVLELGAVRIFSGRVLDYRFDTIDRELSRQGKALRIRQKGKYVYLNLKGKKKAIESITNREEIGVRVGNLKVMQKILNELGYVKIFELDKYRTEYKLDDIKFDIDEYVGLEPMLEIESDSYDKVKKYIEKLKIGEQDFGRVFIREIIAAKKYFNTFNEKKKKKLDIRKL